MLQVKYIYVLVKCLQSVTDRDKRFLQSPVVNRDAGRQELLGAPVMFLPQLQSVRRSCVAHVVVCLQGVMTVS